MPGESLILDEPHVEVRYGQEVEDPRTGLALFGPFSADEGAHPARLTYGVIGPPEGLAAFARFSGAVAGPIPLEDQESQQHLWRPFPGFDVAFCADWPREPTWAGVVDREGLLTASRHADPHQRTYDVVNYYIEALRRAHLRDEQFGVLFCIVPEDVWRNCRPRSRVKRRIGAPPSSGERRLRRMGQRDMFGAYNPEQYHLSVDFRRQLKARAMEFGTPVQIIRETTLAMRPEEAGSRSLTPLADRAWNLATSSYYKAGGKPWRLSSARDGVCYVGLAFRRTEGEDGRTACCAAQMFLDTGDGVVFKGEFGPWYSPERNEYHLSTEAAHDLLAGVLATYKDMGGKALKEVFLHSRSTIWESEFEGYRAACPDGARIVGIRVRRERSEGVKLFREGNWPVLRGTYLEATASTGFLWGTGFVPSLLGYPGWDVPRPLRIDVQHGDADVQEVAKDILGLTKLNYNACRVGESQPVTVGFSDAVGEILVANPRTKGVPQFKYYI